MRLSSVKPNTIEEINQDGVDKLSVQVVRRFSGGGAVYHDMGKYLLLLHYRG